MHFIRANMNVGIQFSGKQHCQKQVHFLTIYSDLLSNLSEYIVRK